ncbi:MAG TPA: WD40 repeat domain-containing protein [Anaerohalosphaeraceae bacterium]|nr:WD40 repeat domain-containing protein [Anaerohalosphaeraceae bacterium]
MSKPKSKFPFWLFAVLLVVVSMIPIISNRLSPAKASLVVRDNTGSSNLLSQGPNLVAVFSNGTVAAWGWANPDQPLWQCSAGTDRLVLLNETTLAGVTKTGRKQFITVDAKQDTKTSEIPVGWEDQSLWPIQSPNGEKLALARVNPDKDGRTLYEFMTLDPAQKAPGLPVSLDVPTMEKRFVDYALSNDHKLLAVGNSAKQGFLVLIDLTQGKVILEKQVPDTQEFTSVAFTPDGAAAYLTNRNGSVYQINPADGEIQSVYKVLKEGQRNPVTNETSSQNITISADGRYVAAVVINWVYVWEIQTGNVVFKYRPDHKLTGAIALSQDGSLLATSDIRASGTIQIWQVKK